MYLDYQQQVSGHDDEKKKVALTPRGSCVSDVTLRGCKNKIDFQLL